MNNKQASLFKGALKIFGGLGPAATAEKNEDRDSGADDVVEYDKR